jgi:pimeloyl-ACP methyl ester carboxylesterase
MENKGGELIVFLHGFPESSVMWERLMIEMAQKGYRCLAPDQRGYSEGARPDGMEHYTHRKLAGDVMALAAYYDEGKKFHLVGHDWGANMGWVLVTLYAERIQTYSALATPYTKDYLEVVIKDPAQRKKSQYIFDFLEPGKSEREYAENHYAKLWAVYPEGFPEDILAVYKALFTQPGALTATINWYRPKFLQALDMQKFEEDIPFGDVVMPVLYIWGTADLYSGKTGVDTAHKYMMNEYKFVQLQGAGHWLMEFNYEVCAKEISGIIEKFPLE